MVMNLSNTKIAFAHKSTGELKKEKQLFCFLQFPLLARFGTKIASCLAHYKLFPTWAFKQIFFDHFCGGETFDEAKRKTEVFEANGVGRVFFYSVEGSSSSSAREILKRETLKTFRTPNSPPTYSALKLTGLINASILEKIQFEKPLNEKEEREYSEFLQVFDELCEEASRTQTQFMIDAEESWFQDVIDKLTFEKMKRYNKEFPLIYTTIQMYRHDSPNKLKKFVQKAKSGNFYFGVKLVRGAYLVKEKKWAAQKGCESVLFRSKEETDVAYNNALKFCFENSDKVALFAGSHNVTSMEIGAKLFENTGRTSFFMTSQLQGMCDYITFNLASAHVPASKYIPFGPADKALPYLIRRAEENSSILGETKKELTLIEEEIRRREKVS